MYQPAEFSENHMATPLKQASRPPRVQNINFPNFLRISDQEMEPLGAVQLVRNGIVKSIFRFYLSMCSFTEVNQMSLLHIKTFRRNTSSFFFLTHESFSFSNLSIHWKEIFAWEECQRFLPLKSLFGFEWNQMIGTFSRCTGNGSNVSNCKAQFDKITFIWVERRHNATMN